MVLIRTHLDRELVKLNESVLDMGGRAVDAFAAGLKAFCEDDQDAANQVIAGDLAINDLRFRIERQCYALLAMAQPVAGDMRSIVAVLTISNELERIGDHGKRIARFSRRLAHEPRPIPLTDISEMGDLAREMVDRALKAYAHRDLALAKNVCLADDQVDARYKQLFNVTLSYMLENPRAIGPGTYLIQVGHEIERVADRGTNIAERAIYAMTGELLELNS